MRKGQFRLHVRPLCDGAFTRLLLCGSVVTAIPPCELRKLSAQLAFWSGWPVELVLPVDVGTAAWFEWWTSAVSETPAHHLEVRFTLEKHRHSRRRRDVA
jgi:hypothetical protein